MKRLLYIILKELFRSVLLILVLLLALGVIEQIFFSQQRAGESFAEGMIRFISSAHLDRNGRPLFEVFFQAAKITLPLVGMALGSLALASMIAGAFFALCRWGRVFRPILAMVSAVPSFLWPFLPFLIFPEREFSGFGTETRLLWPALMLAAGDLNWLMVSTIYAEVLSSELSQPHIRTVRALGGSLVFNIWPRSVMGLLEALAGRIPHLLGGTVALEILLNLKGLGYLAVNAIFSVPMDFSILLWVCGLGVLISRCLFLLQGVLSAILLPHTLIGQTRRDLSEEETENPSQDLEPKTDSSPANESREDQHLANPSLMASAFGDANVSTSPPTIPAIKQPSEGSARMGSFIAWRLWKTRIQYYLLINRANWIKLAMAVFLGVLAVVLVVWAWSHVPPPNPNQAAANNPLGGFRPPTEDHPLGTNASDDDVLTILVRGLEQQAFPLCLAGLISLLAVPFALSDLVTRLSQQRWLIGLGWGLGKVSDFLMEFIESIPKVIILLACFSYFSREGLILKMYIAMGLVLMPQLYRAVRDDAAALKNQIFLDASRTAGISGGRILHQNILRNHLLHIIVIQAALLVASIIHVDAVLGFLGVRNRSSIFTWGSVLGMGIEEFLQFRPLEQVLPHFAFNDGVVWGPFVGVWLGILCAVMFADAIKIPLGGYIYRSK